MSKVKTEGDTEDREQKKAVDTGNISSLTAEKLFQLAAQIEVHTARRSDATPLHAGSYPRFE